MASSVGIVPLGAVASLAPHKGRPAWRTRSSCSHVKRSSLIATRGSSAEQKLSAGGGKIGKPSRSRPHISMVGSNRRVLCTSAASDEAPTEAKPLDSSDAKVAEEGAEEQPVKLLDQCLAEALGTFFIVLFGCGSVCAAIFTGAQAGIWQVAAVWGWGIAISIYSTASISGAHLNPAVSLALAVMRPASFPWSKFLPYCASQLAGATLAGAANLAIFGSAISRFEATQGIVRGTAGSIASAAAFGEYFPNPGMFPGESFISPLAAAAIEAWGTGILTFVIFALSEERNKVLGPHKELAPIVIGFTVAVLISIYAPLTQAGWNPARDLGPRIVAALAGWGQVAIPGPQNGFWVYIIGPMVGAVLGAAAHDRILGRRP